MRLLAALVLIGLLSACDDMVGQPVHHADEPSPDLPGGTSSQAPIPGTVARDEVSALEAAEPPDGWTLADLERGRERYAIFCTPCHGVAGDGDGIVVARGFPRPASLHAQRLRAAPDDHLYAVITDGQGAMFPFAARLTPKERWDVVGYLRTLQLARHAPLDDLPEALRESLEDSEAVP